MLQSCFFCLWQRSLVGWQKKEEDSWKSLGKPAAVSTRLYFFLLDHRMRWVATLGLVYRFDWPLRQALLIARQKAQIWDKGASKKSESKIWPDFYLQKHTLCVSINVSNINPLTSSLIFQNGKRPQNVLLLFSPE